MAKPGKRKTKVRVKEMKFRNDPMVRLYDKTAEWLQESGRPVVRGLGVVVAVVVVVTVVYYIFSYRDSKANAAFAAAIQKYNAEVVDTPPQNPVGKYYTDEKLKWQESADAFEKLSKDYSGYYGTIGKYYAGTAYLHFDRNKGLQLLQQVAEKNDKPTSDLASLALAEDYAAHDDPAKAINYYSKLTNSTFVPKSIAQLGLGHEYEKTGDKEKAIDNYFAVAQVERSSTSPASSDAEKRLTALAPQKLKDLPAPASATVQ